MNTSAGYNGKICRSNVGWIETCKLMNLIWIQDLHFLEVFSARVNWIFKYHQVSSLHNKKVTFHQKSTFSLTFPHHSFELLYQRVHTMHIFRLIITTCIISITWDKPLLKHISKISERKRNLCSFLAYPHETFLQTNKNKIAFYLSLIKFGFLRVWV